MCSKVMSKTYFCYCMFSKNVFKGDIEEIFLLLYVLKECVQRWCQREPFSSCGHAGSWPVWTARLTWQPAGKGQLYCVVALLYNSQHFSLVFRLEGQEEQSARKSAASEKKRNYVKKPLNAFMLFMKEMRPKVIAECTLRESSAINQILGRKVSPFLTAVQLWAWDTPAIATQRVAAMSFLPSVPHRLPVECLH